MAIMGHVKHIKPIPVIGGNTGGNANIALRILMNAIEQAQQIRNCTQLKSPIVNLLDNSISSIMDIDSSLHVEIEQQTEFNILLR